EVDDMPPVQRLRARQRSRLAVAAIAPAIIDVHVGTARSAYQRTNRNITDAVRPRVIGIQAHTAAQALLHRKDEPVIARGSAGLELVYKGQVFSFLRIDQIGQTALIGIGGRIARRRLPRGASQRTRHEHGRVELPAGPDVRSLGAQIADRNQPAISELALDTQIPSVRGGSLGVRLLRDVVAVLDKWSVRSQAESAAKRVAPGD